MDIEIKEVMDRKLISDSIDAMMSEALKILSKPELTADDYEKIKVMRSMQATLACAAQMVRCETKQLRIALSAERLKMKQKEKV